MDCFSMILKSISDNIMMFSQIFIMSAITGKQYIKLRVIISTLLVILSDFAFELLFYEIILPVQYIFLVINSIKMCLLTLYVLNICALRHILAATIIQFSCSVINSGINSVITLSDDINQLHFRSLSLAVIRFCIFFVSVTVKMQTKNNIKNDRSYIIPLHIYILILADIFIENGLIEVINYQSMNTESKTLTVKVLSLLLIICTSVLIISLAINVIYRRYYISLNDILEDQVKNQLSHYKKMDRINTEIRKFRHDYTNHISCLLNMIKGKRYEEAEQYIINMSGKLPAENLVFKTGNYVADAILTDKQDEADDNITIQFDGCIISEINSTDLCIILSNAVDNAVEACREIPGKKIISVYGNYQQGYFVLIIKNPTINTFSQTDQLPPTSKEDNTHHGFGLSNIKYTVEKYNGKMDISVENGLFVLSIAFSPVK